MIGGKILKNVVSYIRKNHIILSVSGICVYALYLRLTVLYYHSLWADELYQLSEMKGTFLDLLKELPRAEYCAYLSGDYCLIYPFFKIFAFNKWGLAIPHIIATIAGFYILYLICKRYFKSIWAYLITFGIVCFNATLINHATEIRVYAVLPTLALATFYLFQRLADLNFELNIPRKIGATIFFVLLIWFHLYGILIFFSCLLFTVLSRHKEKNPENYFKNMASFNFIVLLISMPLWLYSVFGTHLGYRLENTFYYIPNPLHNPLGFLKDVLGNLVGFKKLYFLLLCIIVPFVFSYEDRRKQSLFLIFMVIIPIGLTLFSDVVQRYWFLQRQFIWVMPLFAFLLGWMWDSFFVLLSAVTQRRAE